MSVLNGKKILLGLSGGIACYKIAELTRLLTKAGAQVQVVMSEAACQFITPITMQALSGRTVYTDQWDARVHNNMAHIELSRDADLFVIAPCSADCIANLAAGKAHDLLSLLALARPASLPLVIAPAMNVEMWQNPATQRNVKLLVSDGVTLSGPGQGVQACGETGLGRMLEPDEIFADCQRALSPQVIRQKRVLITAGPTFEAIDPVRGITNLSSGKMGYALAQAAREAGAQVHLISGPTALTTPYGVSVDRIQSAQEMHDAVHRQLDANPYDVFIAVAAVADWRVAQVSPVKLKKDQQANAPTLNFVANPDILATVAQRPDHPYCVGFAAESENLEQYAAAKRVRKGIPLLIGNLGPATFGRDDNTVILFDDHGSHPLPAGQKEDVARQLIQEIARRIHP